MREAEETLADAVARDPERLAGQELRRFRIARGWTQEDVARRMRTAGHGGWHQTTIAKIEGAQRPLRVRDLVALAGVLGVAPHDMLPSDAWNVQTLDEIEAELPRLEALRDEAAKRAADADAARAELLRLDGQIAYLRQIRDLAKGTGGLIRRLRTQGEES